MARFSDRFGSRRIAILAAAGLLAVGGGVGAGAMYAARPVAAMGPVAITPIASLATTAQPMFGDKVTSVRGRVAEVYGSRFTLKDASGTALVEAGRRGDGLVSAGQQVTVQGRFGDGVLRAAFLVGADGTVTALDPRSGPHGDRRHGRHGGPDRGPDGGPDRTPPPREGDAPRPAADAPDAPDA